MINILNIELCKNRGHNCGLHVGSMGKNSIDKYNKYFNYMII